MRFSWIKFCFVFGGLTACGAMVSDADRPIRTQADLVDYLHFHPPRTPSWWGGCETQIRSRPDGGAQEVVCWDGSMVGSENHCPPPPPVHSP